MDVRSAPMPTATAGPSRPHHEPRFSWVERPALPPITSFATRGLMKQNNGDSHQPFNPRADRVRFLIFSRQRSASNTLLNELQALLLLNDKEARATPALKYHVYKGCYNDMGDGDRDLPKRMQGKLSAEVSLPP